MGVICRRCGALPSLAVLAPMLFFGFAAPAALPPPSPSPPVFEERPFGPRPAATPPRPSVVRTDAPEPISRTWLLGGAASIAVIGGGLMFFAIRAWRLSRLFGRQYVFPVHDGVALRLGGERSGGLLATARFGDNREAARARSEAKDT